MFPKGWLAEFLEESSIFLASDGLPGDVHRTFQNLPQLCSGRHQSVESELEAPTAVVKPASLDEPLALGRVWPRVTLGLCQRGVQFRQTDINTFSFNS